MRWPTVPLDTLKSPNRYSFVGGPFGSELTTRDYVADGVPVIRGNNLSGPSKFHDDDYVYVGEKKAKALQSNLASPGDLVFTQRGTLGQVGLIPADAKFEKYLISQSQMKLTVDENKATPLFLYYFFKMPSTIQQIVNRVSSSGVPHINLSVLKAFEVPAPDKDIQDSIVEFVRHYDDLIENNRRRIALLEQAARLLYEEWFVRFRFPGHEHAKFINGLPSGWHSVQLDELCHDVREHAEPNGLDAATPYIGLEHLPRRSITLCDWGKAEDVTSGKFSFSKNDILFGKIRPYFHKVGFALTDGITSSDAIVIRPNEESLFCYCLCLLSSDSFVAFASKTVKEGSKMPRADWKFLSEQRFTLPPDGLLTDFSSKIAPITLQLKSLAFQTKKATTARDLLLPRLMSGEVEV